MDRNADKHAAAVAAVQEIEQGMLIGIGTGSTAAYAIAEIGRRCADGLRIEAVVTSVASEALARAAGIVLRPLDDVAHVDLAIDGVDEIDPQLRAIKGAGGAMLREKIVATAARRMVAIADGGKRAARIGQARVPIEVLPIARAFVADRIAAIGGDAALRPAGPTGAAPYRTDQGNIVIDCRFDSIADPAALAARLAAIPGLLGHGLFVDEIDALYVADGGKVDRIERPAASAR